MRGASVRMPKRLWLQCVPGDTVAEIGCDAPAFSSLLACRAGARRVFAIELDDSIQFARQPRGRQRFYRPH